MNKLARIWVFILFWAVDCQPATPIITAPPPKVEVTEQVLPFQSPAPTPACMELPSGVEFLITPLSSSEVRIDLKGMMVSEALGFVFVAQFAPSGAKSIESRPIAPVGQDGSYSITQGGLTPLADAPNNTWTIRVIHSRGVACQEITLD